MGFRGHATDMAAPTRSESTSSSASITLAESLLYELIELPPDQRASALRQMRAEHPEHADTLRRRLALLAESLPVADGPSIGAFGRFELLRRLGGGMSEVYLATDPHSATQVVVKILRHPELLDAETQQGFAREALAASRLQHPCIGSVLEIGACDGVPYLVQPYQPGLTLAEWIQNRRARGIPLRAADLTLLLGWLEDILRALHAAHEFGLVHRDVKPANILIPYQGRPRLLDFGLCQEIRSTPDAGTPTPAAGTPAYMAPELLSPRERPVGPAADIYAMGVTLYECAAQRLPFQGDNRQELHRAILLQDPPRLRRLCRGLPPGLCRVVSCALQKQAWERYPTAAAFADDLQRLREGRPVLAPRRRQLQRLRRWSQRHRATSALALVAGLLLLSVPVFEQMAEARLAGGGDLLATSARLLAAEARADELVPGWPEQVPALERWLQEQGDPLSRQLPSLRERAAAVNAEPGGDPAEGEALRVALARLEAFAEPGGVLAMVRERLDWARSVGQLTVTAVADEWRQTAAAVAADPRYGGLRLVPQYGLVPLGRDPVSGLFEFYHPRSAWSGDAPPVARDEKTGRLVPHDGSGMVFVLIPPGRFLMGQQREDKALPRYDPEGSDYASPHEVELDAFLLSKYEMTQGQWYKLTGERPSTYRVGERYNSDPPITYKHPVESVSALDCDEVLRDVGLCLPTESQWEYACGGGASTFWFFGNDAKDLPTYGNCRDLSYVRSSSQSNPFVDGNDGYTFTAPVGSYTPNLFGLCDTIGNVGEWCRDYWVSYENCTPAPGDGLRQGVVTPHSERLFRGGSFQENPFNHARTANRPSELRDRRAACIGLRPARALQGVR